MPPYYDRKLALRVAAAASAAGLGIRDHQEGIAVQVPVELGSAVERLSLAVSRDDKSIKASPFAARVLHETSWPV